MERPTVILNAGMTLDGKISTIYGDSDISCREDLKRVHDLRSKVDAVMVGIGTVLADDPELTVRLVKGENPIRIIADSKAKIPLEARVLEDTAHRIVAVARIAPDKNKVILQKRGIQVIVAGMDKVDLNKLLIQLKDRGIEKLLLEGGSTLNWGMLKQGLVDEIQVAIAPKIIGGKGAKTLVGGTGFKRIIDGIDLELMKSEIIGENLLLKYRVMDGVK